MTGGPTNKNDAALRIIMGELAPLIQRAEEIVETNRQLIEANEAAHEDLNGDLMRLGETVQQMHLVSEGLKDGHTDYIKDIKTLAKYIEGKFKEINVSKSTQIAPKANKASFWLPLLVSSLLMASVTIGAVYYMTLDSRNDALLGQRLKEAWPKLDKDTQDKLNKTFAKGGV